MDDQARQSQQVSHATVPRLTPERPVEVFAPEAPSRRLRIALAHDWLCGKRGGEFVLERIAALVAAEHELDAIYTMFDDGRGVAPAIDAAGHVVWPAGRTRAGAGPARRWLMPLYPRAVEWLSRRLAESHARRSIDLLISTSSAAIKGLRPPEGVPHLCYCHSPARYVWAPEADHSGGLRALGLRLWAPRFRRWDRDSSRHVTRFLANSHAVAARIASAYAMPSRVVAPPVRTDFYTPDASVAREDFWLCAGALEPYKRVDLAIEAARRGGARLVVAGSGTCLPALRRLAIGARVEFVESPTDENLRDLYRRARLLVFPQVEDFGIVAVEAQACGTPVVARRAGGALDSVIEGRTGVFFDEATPESLLAAIPSCPRPGEACRRNAERFGLSEFDGAVRGEIAALATSAAESV